MVPARLLYIPVMLVGGLHFCLIGTVLGTMLFLALWGIAQGKPEMVLGMFASADNAIMALFLGAICGAPPAFVTGLVAGPLRLHIDSRLLFAAIMAPTGAVATFIYLLILAPLLGAIPPLGIAMLAGAGAAFCCALVFGFLRRTRPAPSSGRG
jgi:hypothetical protein